MNRNAGNQLFDYPSQQGSHSQIPRPRGSAMPQPTYDFLTGAPSEADENDSSYRHNNNVHRSRLPLGQSTSKTLPVDTEALRSEINALQYELSTLKNDREMERVRHEDEIRNLERKVEDEAKKADLLETDKRFLFEKTKSLSQELEEIKSKDSNDIGALEREVRTLKAEISELREELGEKEEEVAGLKRGYKRKLEEAETRNKATSEGLEGLQKEYDELAGVLRDTQGKLSESEVEIAELKSEVMKAKASGSDAETLSILERELTQQVEHIKNLEKVKARNENELSTLRSVAKRVEALEEDKYALENKLKLMDDLRREVSEKELQISMLQDEKNAWKSFLEDENVSGEFNSPEELARALMGERVEKAQLIDRLGRVDPELKDKDETIIRLETELGGTNKRLNKIKESYEKLFASRQRIERNRDLALKEASMLREQLKTFDTEATVMMEGNYDTQKTRQLADLETLLNSYKETNSKLLSEISTLERNIISRDPFSIPSTSSTSNNNNKRAREPETSTTEMDSIRESEERIGQLLRRTRHLQDQIVRLEKSEALAKRETKSLQSRIKSLEASSQAARERILELRDNPTSRIEKVKMEDLRNLKEENRALLEQIQGRMDQVGKVVPMVSLENLKLEISRLQKEISEKEKRMTRLKTIWTQKSIEWRQAVHSIMGVLFDFMPNGRVKISSELWKDNQATSGQEEEGEEESIIDEYAIIFDGEKGTMKIPSERFREEIRPLVKYWVEERREIPCLIAALMMKGFENENENENETSSKKSKEEGERGEQEGEGEGEEGRMEGIER